MSNKLKVMRGNTTEEMTKAESDQYKAERALDAIKAKKEEAKIKRIDAIKKPINGFNYDPINIMGAVLAFLVDPTLAEIKWRMADNSHQIKTKAEIMAAFSGFIDQTQAAYNQQEIDEK